MYRVSPKRKKHIVETEIFRKKDYEIRRSETWRKGWVLISNEIDFADYDSDSGINVWDLDIEDHEFIDGSGSHVEFPENLSEEESDILETIFDGSDLSVMSSIGWEHYDTEVYFFGELDIEEI